jgi:flagellar motor switch protein FliN
MSDINEQIAAILTENWSSVFTMLLGKEPKIALQLPVSMPREELGGLGGEFAVWVKMNFSEADGDLLLLGTSKKEVSIVANLMMGLDQFSDEIGDDDRDAFVEAANQLFASCQVPLKETLGVDHKFSGAAFLTAAEVAAVLPVQPLVAWRGGVTLPGLAEEKLVLVTPESFMRISESEAADVGEVSVSAPVSGQALGTMTGRNIELLMDMELPITVRIGSTEMKLIDIMKIGIGSIIELEKMVDDPVEVLVNDRLVARGEVVVLDNNFAIRIIEVESRENRIRSLA